MYISRKMIFFCISVFPLRKLCNEEVFIAIDEFQQINQPYKVPHEMHTDAEADAFDASLQCMIGTASP